MVTVYPTGTTIYKPDKCWNGHTLIPFEREWVDAGPSKTRTGNVKLIDMNGNIVYTWPKEVVGGQGRAYLLRNGVLITFAGKYRPPSEEHSCGWVVELDWEGNLIRKPLFHIWNNG
ncbi:unnamed protein product [marine sediment metagenome]|uniref:Uncharacterized protein n=1 Tax=marine sediment metagenome TaxID=412755 RepID=X0ZJZ8_9ZZZZ